MEEPQNQQLESDEIMDTSFEPPQKVPRREPRKSKMAAVDTAIMEYLERRTQATEEENDEEILFGK